MKLHQWDKHYWWDEREQDYVVWRCRKCGTKVTLVKGSKPALVACEEDREGGRYELD